MPRYTRPSPQQFGFHPGVKGALSALQEALGPALTTAGVVNATTEYSAQAPQGGIEGASANTSSRVDVFGRAKGANGAPAYVCSFDAAFSGSPVAPVVTLSNYRTYTIPGIGAPTWAGRPETNTRDDNGTAALPTIGSW
jgi:hypothetical protein